MYDDFARYLAAKRSVDDRALNRQVWNRLAAAVREIEHEPLHVLEVGAGIGTMVERVRDWGLSNSADYTAIDADPMNIAAARARLAHSELHLEAIDLFDFMLRERGKSHWDLLIAHAFLDLVDIPATLPDLLALLAPGGLFYFTIVFDGVTSFLPEIDPEFDAQIERLYHQTMDERVVAGRRSGDSHSGRHLFRHLRAAGAELLAAGPSDWCVYPGRGGYLADEAYFLQFIIATVDRALRSHPQLDAERFAAWIQRRHAQIDRGELVYLAHQLDFVGRVGASPMSGIRSS